MTASGGSMILGTRRWRPSWPPRHRRDALRTMFVYYYCRASSFPASLTASSRDTQTGWAVSVSGARFK